MEHIFREIRAAVTGNALVLALFGILAIPDICGALASQDGRATGSRYKAWFAANLGSQYPSLDAAEFYKMRCSMLHQGATATANYCRTIFTPPGPVTIHNSVVNDALVLDLPTFSEDLIAAAESWLVSNGGDEPVKSNLARLVRWHPHGLAPYIVGTPIIS